MMHGPEKSDPVIVAGKPTNKAERSAAELAEPRTGTKGNADRQSTHWTQSQARVSQALERIRQAVAVTHPRWEPHAGKPHVRICAGGARQLASLPLKRRAFIAGLGGAAAWPVVARAQQTRPRIGVLTLSTPQEASQRVTNLLNGLRELGYTEHQTIEIDYRFASGDTKLLKPLAQELTALQPNVAFGGEPSAVRALKSIAPNLPIVCPTISDVLIPELAASYARPSGSVTGIAISVEGVTDKLLELRPRSYPASFVSACWPIRRGHLCHSMRKDLAKVREPVEW